MIWRLILGLISLLAVPLLLWHPRLRCNLKERLGLYPQLPPKTGPWRFWLHGASGGDLVTLVPLARSLKTVAPGSEIIVSALTRSGIEMANRYKDVFDRVYGQPVDGLFAPQRAFSRLKPDALILEYAEIWPGLIHAAKKHQALVVLNNGRIAPENVNKYRLLSKVCGGIFQKIDAFLMRNDDEARSVRAAGAHADRVWVTGNTKFDALRGPESPDKVKALSQALRIPSDVEVWTCGSTHEGEETILLNVFKKLRKTVPELRLIIAPRYTERGARIADMAIEKGFHVWQRSNGNVPVSEHVDVYIMDTMGELQAAYGLATITFVGGSLVPRGGQNILEPAAESKAVLFGPMMATQKDLVEALVGRGGIQIQDEVHLAKVLTSLFSNPAERISLGNMASHQVAQIRGASQKNANHILNLLKEREG